MSDIATSVLSKEEKNTIFENMSDGVMTVDQNGIINYTNTACEKLFHLQEEEMNGQVFQDVFLGNSKNKEFNKLFHDCMEKNCMTEKTIVKYNTPQGVRYLSIDISLVQQTGTTLRRKEPFQGMMILIEDATDNYTLHQREHDCAYIFAGLILCISVYLFAWRFIRFTLHIHLSTYIYTLMIEGITFLLFLEIIFFTSLKMREIGLVPRFKTIKKDARTTFLLSLAGCVVLLLVRIIFILFKLPGKSYFIGGSLRGLSFYVLTAFFQEFLARGVIQTCVKSLMQVKFQKAFGIFLTSLLFSLMHMPFGFVFMISAFLLSLFLGTLYERQGSIWGCAFLHWSCGYLAMALFF